MNWQAIGTRLRSGLSSLRRVFTSRLTLRLISAAAAIGCLTIGLEAAIVARLDGPLSRVPTAIYSRPAPWGGGERTGALLLAAADDRLTELRIPVARRQVPDHLIEAILAVEDQRYLGHHGLDFRRIAGALLANVRARRIVQGGSTLTQQLAKNLFLTAERTPLRKLREATMAVVLELRHDKVAILEAYLNEVYFGQDGSRPIHGVGGAARYYFGKSVGKIGLAESALLAAMIQAPNRYHPLRNERQARRRRNLVLSLMADQGRISAAAADRATRNRLTTRTHSPQTVDARYFRDLVMAQRPRGLPSRGAAIYTTLDPTLQLAAERAVREGLTRFPSREVQAALVALDPRSGEILALVGGRDYRASQFNRATEARRQPGSAFKPIVALAALHREGRRGPAYTLASRVEDEPLSVMTPSGRWEPNNYDRSFRGVVTVRQAIEQSLNVPFARIGLEIGPDRIIETARRLGIASPLRPVPSLALGSSEVTLLELVRAYGVFATGGSLAATRVVLGQGSLGSVPTKPGPPALVRVADPAESYLVTSALEGVISRGTGQALRVAGRFGSIAGKTGTSNGWRDAWFLAYSRSLVVGVWVGFDDGRSLGLTGAGAALPIVERFLERATPDDRWESFPIPEGIEVASVAGGESGWFDDCGGREVFLEGTAPPSECDRFELPEWDEDDDSGWERSRPAWDRELEIQARQLARRLARLWERTIER
jgi:penicillin-binding protein 1B